MEQIFKYETEIFRRAIQSWGIKNISLENHNSIAKSINTILHLIDLEDYIIVTNVSENGVQTTFTLKSKTDVTKTIYFEKLKLFQLYLNSFLTNINDEKNGEEFIRDLDRFIDSIPKAEFDIFIIPTYQSEENIRISNNFPKYFYYVTIPKNINFYSIRDYYSRRNLMSFDSSKEEKLYIYGREKNKDKMGCLGLIMVFVIIILTRNY